MGFKEGYKKGYFIGGYIGNFIAGFIRLLYVGIIVMSKKYKLLILVYLFEVFGCLVTYNLFANCNLFSILLCLTCMGANIWNYILEYPEMKMRNEFNEIFETVGLNGDDILYAKTVQSDTNYATIYWFCSFVPLSEWIKKQDLLELHLNKKIIEISQMEDDKKFIYIAVENNSLPTRVDWEDKYMTEGLCPTFAVGVGYFDLIQIDLKKNAHFFVGGTTGSGKSNILKCLIHQALYKNYTVNLIDFKRAVSFSEFKNDIKIYYEYDEAQELLETLVSETKKRLDLLRENNCEDIDDFNKYSSNNTLNRIILFIDEVAELLSVRDKELSHSLYDSLETLTRLSRATGIHLILGMQRVDSTIITGQIKANVTGRISGRFADKEPSRIVLGNDLASKLPLITGRCIYKDATYEEFQSFYYKKSRQNNNEITQLDTYEQITDYELERKITFDFDDIT